MVKTALFFLLLLGTGAEAEIRSLFDRVVRSAPLRDVVFRLELTRNTASPIKKTAKKEPNRVYLSYNASLKTWTYVLSDKHRNLPAHAIATGTVLAGTRLGGRPALRYRLNDEKRWVETDEAETLKVWETSTPRPKARTYLIPLDPDHTIARTRAKR